MKLHGTVPVMLLPFSPDESIDEASFRKQVDFAIEAGAVAVCAPGFATRFVSSPTRSAIGWRKRWLSKLAGACRRS